VDDRINLSLNVDRKKVDGDVEVDERKNERTPLPDLNCKQADIVPQTYSVLHKIWLSCQRHWHKRRTKPSSRPDADTDEGFVNWKLYAQSTSPIGKKSFGKLFDPSGRMMCSMAVFKRMVYQVTVLVYQPNQP